MSTPAADYSGKLCIGHSCLCFTRWSRPRQAHLHTSDAKPVLQIESGGKVKEVSLVNAALGTKSTNFCSSCGDEDKMVEVKISAGKRLLLKAENAEEREEWKRRLEAAMLLPLLTKKGRSTASVPAAVETEDEEDVVKDAQGPQEEDQSEQLMLPVSILPEKKDGAVKDAQEPEVVNQEEMQGEEADPAKSLDVYALSEGHTTWQRVREESEESNSSQGMEGSVDESPPWMDLIKRGEVLEPDMMDFDYENMFEEAAQMKENLVPRRSALINSILKQLVQTMSPSKVRLPACVLEPRSLLQSYGSALGRSDLFTSISEAGTPHQRFERVVAFYLSQLKCMRPTREALKPYNPTLGEIFVNEWPGADLKAQCPVYFLAEQVSHHPPVSAFYAESRPAGVFYVGSLATVSGIKCKFHFWPDVLTVENRGEARLVLVRHDEHFKFTFPSAEACDILGSEPWLQLAGDTTLTASTGEKATFAFSGKDWVDGEMMAGDGTIVAKLSGNWRNQVKIWEMENGEKRVLLDMTNWKGGEVGMKVAPVALQEEKESRRMWRKLTRALMYQPGMADEEKALVEDEIRLRDSGAEYSPRFFEVALSEDDEGLNTSASFKYPLVADNQTNVV